MPQLLLICMLLIVSSTVWARDVSNIPSTAVEPGTVGLGFGFRIDSKPYVGVSTRYDLVPLYLYDGDYFFAHGTYGGWHLYKGERFKLDLMAQYRFDGHHQDQSPALTGMEWRRQTVDAGLSAQFNTNYGDFTARFLHDTLSRHKGWEASLVYGFDWWPNNRFLIRPNLGVFWQSAELADYYYGVRTNEATADRPAYRVGAVDNLRLGFDLSYYLTKRAIVFADYAMVAWDSDITASPIVADDLSTQGFVGFAYLFGSIKDRPREDKPRSPIYLRVGGGPATNCRFMEIIFAGCFDTNTTDDTSVVTFEIGKPLQERFNDWPLDFVGKLGLIRHLENNVQDDFNSYTASVKAYFYGFPWSKSVMTRVGFAFGLSYAEKIPAVERRFLEERGENTSNLLNYLDFSIDVSIGDIFRFDKLRKTFFGFAVPHRSGIFGTSDILGNVNGGSNWLTLYVETLI